MRPDGGGGPLPASVWVLAVVVVAVALRVAAFAPLELLHPDEILQYLEQGNRLATGHGIVPWEARLGMRNGLVPQLLSAPIWVGRTLAPDTLAGMYLARGLFAALTLAVLPAAWRIGALVSRRAAFAALFVAAIWWESVLYSELLLSESLGTAVLLLAAAPLLAPAESSRGWLFAAGLLAGIGVLVRLQFAPFAAVLVAWALIRAPGRWRPIVAGGIAAIAIGAISDMAYGLVPYSWILANVSQNVVADRAAQFGVRGPFYYLAQFGRHVGVAAPLIALGACFSGARLRPLLVAALLTVLLHSFIAHKEYRFVWIAVLTLLVLGAVASVALLERIAVRRGWTRDRALVLACLLWALLSLASWRAGGGFDAWRGGGTISRLAIAADEAGGTCGIVLAKDYRFYVVPSLLPRAVPLSIAPQRVYENTSALPHALAHAGNALLTRARPGGFPGWSQDRCEPIPGETVCLYRRPGTCRPDSRFSYQAMLESYGQ